MGVVDLVMVGFLIAVVIVGVGGFIYYNNSENDLD